MPSPDYLSVRQAAAILPGRPHYNSVRRWMTTGVYGVRLRSMRFGGKRFTTAQWCDEFVAATQEASPDIVEDLRAQAKLDALGV